MSDSRQTSPGRNFTVVQLFTVVSQMINSYSVVVVDYVRVLRPDMSNTDLKKVWAVV